MKEALRNKAAEVRAEASDGQKMRAAVISWWNNLDKESKHQTCKSIYPTRDYITLTGREIEYMYNKLQKLYSKWFTE
jgi:hypothetical protein